MSTAASDTMSMIGGGPAPTVMLDEAEPFALLAVVLRVNGLLSCGCESQSATAPESTALYEPSLSYHWTLVQVPDTVSRVILSRLDRLDEPVRNMVRVASVIGRAFQRWLLQSVYPYQAQRFSITGYVKAGFVVDEEGSVSGIEIIESIPEGIFDESVRNALVRARFRPGTIDGEPVATRVVQVIRFDLE